MNNIQQDQATEDSELDKELKNKYDITLADFKESVPRRTPLAGGMEHAFAIRIKSYLDDKIMKDKFKLIPALRKQIGNQNTYLQNKLDQFRIPTFCLFLTQDERRCKNITEVAEKLAEGQHLPTYAVLSLLAKNFGLNRKDRFDFLVEGIGYALAGKHQKIEVGKTGGAIVNRESEFTKALEVLTDSRHWVERDINGIREGAPEAPGKGKNRISASFLDRFVPGGQGRITQLINGHAPRKSDEPIIKGILAVLKASPDERTRLETAFEAATAASAASATDSTVKRSVGRSSNTASPWGQR